MAALEIYEWAVDAWPCWRCGSQRLVSVWAGNVGKKIGWVVVFQTLDIGVDSLVYCKPGTQPSIGDCAEVTGQRGWLVTMLEMWN